MSDHKIKRKGRWSTAVSMLCFIFIGAGSGLAMIPLIEYFLEGDGNLFIGIMGILIMISLMYVALFFEMAAHEAGHLVFGLATGYKFVSYRIGSFIFFKEEGRIKVKRYSLPGTGGQCLMEMPKYSPSFPFVLYNAGGSIFNFLSSLLFLVIFYFCMDLPFISSFFLLSSFISLGLGAMNIIPLIYGNDGSNIVAIKKSEKERKCFWCQMKMASLQNAGMRLRDMDEEVFPVRRIEDVESSMSAAALSYYASFLLDCGKIEDARKVEEELISSAFLPPVLLTLLKLDLLYGYLVLGEGKEKISSFKDKAMIKEMKAMRGLLPVMRTEYAYALIYEGNEKKAEDIRKAFSDVASTYPYEGDVEGEEELMDLALSRYGGR
ncbi:MAG: hypothetical protein ACI4S4_02470 [Candidatus Ornithospirochaeta sp.]